MERRGCFSGPEGPTSLLDGLESAATAFCGPDGPPVYPDRFF